MRKKKFLTLSKAKNWAIENKIKTSSEWRFMSKDGLIPKDIPGAPDVYYKNSGWIGWKAFLGTKLSKKNSTRLYSTLTKYSDNLDFNFFNMKSFEPKEFYKKIINIEAKTSFIEENERTKAKAQRAYFTDIPQILSSIKDFINKDSVMYKRIMGEEVYAYIYIFFLEFILKIDINLEEDKKLGAWLIPGKEFIDFFSDFHLVLQFVSKQAISSNLILSKIRDYEGTNNIFLKYTRGPIYELIRNNFSKDTEDSFLKKYFELIFLTKIAKINLYKGNFISTSEESINKYWLTIRKISRINRRYNNFYNDLYKVKEIDKIKEIAFELNNSIEENDYVEEILPFSDRDFSPFQHSSTDSFNGHITNKIMSASRDISSFVGDQELLYYNIPKNNYEKNTPHNILMKDLYKKYKNQKLNFSLGVNILMSIFDIKIQHITKLTDHKRSSASNFYNSLKGEIPDKLYNENCYYFYQALFEAIKSSSVDGNIGKEKELRYLMHVIGCLGGLLTDSLYKSHFYMLDKLDQVRGYSGIDIDGGHFLDIENCEIYYKNLEKTFFNKESPCSLNMLMESLYFNTKNKFHYAVNLIDYENSYGYSDKCETHDAKDSSYLSHKPYEFNVLRFKNNEFDLKNSIKFKNPYEFLITTFNDQNTENTSKTRTFLNPDKEEITISGFEVREDLIPENILQYKFDTLFFQDVDDDSMSPEIEPGDKVIYLPIMELNLIKIIEYGSLYCVGGGDIRRVVKTGDLKKDTILLMPSNQVKWPSAEVKLKDIELIGKVIGVIKAL